MDALLSASRAIDWINKMVGRVIIWFVLASVLVSAGNAAVRKMFDTSSNAWLEIQWYLFSAIFLLCAGYTLLRNEHVRIDVLSGMLPKKGQIWIDIVGFILFLMPMAVLVTWYAWPLAIGAYHSREMSSNAGGLIRWPVYMLVPVGFLLLGLQGISELIKRFAFLQGRIEDPTIKRQMKSAEEELAEVIRSEAERKVASEFVDVAMSKDKNKDKK